MASLCLIKEFRNIVSNEIKLTKSGTLYAYTEVCFDGEGKYRFDGLLLIVAGGKIKDAAIFEMKNRSNEILKDQMENYISIAKQIGLEKLVSISNQFVSKPTQYPLQIKTPKNISLYHLSWSYLLTLAHILIFDNDTNIEDPDQLAIMNEVVSYFENPIAGVMGFTKMKAGWKDTIEKVNAKTRLKLNDKCVEDAVSSWQQEERDMALILSRLLGLLVKSGSPKYRTNLQLRIQEDKKQLVNEKTLTSALDISGAASNLMISAFLENRTIEMMAKLNPPADKTIRGQIGWIKKQLATCEKKDPKSFGEISSNLVIGVNIKHAKGTDRYFYKDIDKIIDTLKGREINDFRIILFKDFGKSFSSVKKFIVVLEEMLVVYYKTILQYLKKWELQRFKTKNNFQLLMFDNPAPHNNLRLYGYQTAGAVLRIRLSGPVYVRLVDYKNFHRYRLGRSFSYWGGRSRKLEFMFRIPEYGRYLVIVDTIGIGGSVESSIQYLGLPSLGLKELDGVVELPLREI